MLTLPIPMIVALVLGFLFARSWVKRDRPQLFSALLACCALQGGRDFACPALWRG